MRRHVFLSHSSVDAAAALDWLAVAEGAGLPCWIAPRDILPSADWAEQIIEGIDGAWALVLLLTDASNRSTQVRREVERAVHKRVPVLPLRIEDVVLSKSLEYFLSAQHWLDATRGDPARHRAALVDALRRLHDAEARAGTRTDAHGSVPAPPPRPTPALAPAPPAWDAALLATLRRALALELGPVAPVLVERAARTARGPDELVALLAVEIDDPAARQRFVAAHRHA